LVFKQKGGTCAIASQVELEEAAKIIPTDAVSASSEEARLYGLAAKGNLFTGNPADQDRRADGGTPNQYIGDLLPFPTEKHIHQTNEQLFSAVSSGQMVIVWVDPGILWNQQRYLHEGHVVVITGAEVDKKSGSLLGYYINDTGTGEGARLVTKKQFTDAWMADGHNFVVPAL